MKILEEYRRGSLCSRTTLTITLVTTAFLLFTLTVLAIFVVVPTAQRSAHEMASLVLLSTEALRSVEEVQRKHFIQHLFYDYELDLTPPPADLYPRQRHTPFFLLLEQAFRDRLGKDIAILQSDMPGKENNYWARFDDGHAPLYVGFEYSHKWLDPPAIILIIIVVGLLATFVTGMSMARRLTRPLKQLAASTRQLGSSGNVGLIPETGPLELKELVASFNRMSTQIHDLIANRTTLLAGISHDLRTPLTRMELSVEMLAKDSDTTLIVQLRRDITHMNRLIGQFLEISRGLQEGCAEYVDIRTLLTELATDYQGTGKLRLNLACPPCRKVIHPLAFKRIVTNLLDNALRYGKGEVVDLRAVLQQGDNGTQNVVIEVCDRGPGIPETERKAVFRPFFRLERSRSSETGGSGLGLSIVQQLANAHHCQIELLAREGGGTIARVTVPAVET